MQGSHPVPSVAAPVQTTKVEKRAVCAPRPRARRGVRRLRVASCLAPHLCGFYRSVAQGIGRQLGLRIEFAGNVEYDQLDNIDLAFVCSLAYIEHPAIRARFLPLAAPVLRGARYGGQPVYYSDVIVRRRSPLQSFADLRGRSWAYNEAYSQSGYGITRYHLARAGETRGYFGRLRAAGRHDRAIRLVTAGQIDAAAIDSHHLETYLLRRPRLAAALRVIDTLGPSPIQPVLVRHSLSEHAREDLGSALEHLPADPAMQSAMAGALVERFVRVDDRAYDPVRRMREVAAAAGLLVLSAGQET
jgi:phosphonate transport system substrate-binding protein